MSQVTHPRISLPMQVRPSRTAWIGALLVLTGALAVALVLALGSDSSDDATLTGGRAAQQSGPSEAGIAAAVGSHATSPPNEAGIATAVGTSSSAGSSTSAPNEAGIATALGTSSSAGSSPRSGPSESSTAAAVSSSTPTSGGPDESRTGASISGR